MLLGYSRERFGMGIKSVLAVSKPGSAPFALVGSGDGTIAAITGSLFTVSRKRQAGRPGPVEMTLAAVW